MPPPHSPPRVDRRLRRLWRPHLIGRRRGAGRARRRPSPANHSRAEPRCHTRALAACALAGDIRVGCAHHTTCRDVATGAERGVAVAMWLGTHTALAVVRHPHTHFCVRGRAHTHAGCERSPALCRCPCTVEHARHRLDHPCGVCALCARESGSEPCRAHPHAASRAAGAICARRWCAARAAHDKSSARWCRPPHPCGCVPLPSLACGRRLMTRWQPPRRRCGRGDARARHGVPGHTSRDEHKL